MSENRPVKKLKVIEGYREPSSTTFTTSSTSIQKIKIYPGIEAEIQFTDQTRYYPWHRILNYEK